MPLRRVTTLQGKLCLFDAAAGKLVRTLVLREGGQGTRAVPGPPAFSPDGKWAALMTQLCPEARGDQDVHDLPQPRIHLIDLPAGEVCETLIAPQAFAGSVCFSPDSRALASPGDGRVLLWDLTQPPSTPGRAARPGP
jgi:hypothetical protein